MTLFEHRDRIINEILKPAFKSAGFKVSGMTFRKSEKDFMKIFNIQSSGFNLQDNVSFYLNIGILFPIWFEIREETRPKTPKEYDCQFRIRSNSLTGRNQFYEITPQTNLEDLENLIRSDLNHYVLPFFERYVEIEDCLKLNTDVPDHWTDCRAFIGLTMIKNGHLEQGNKIIDEFIPTTGKTWAEELEKFRRKLNINASS